MKKSFDQMTKEEVLHLFPVSICEHKIEWKEIYRKEKRLIKRSIGKRNIVRMSHIGSTAVPGLMAKPTIDILLEIQNDVDIPKLISGMESCGHIYDPQPENPPPHMKFMKGYTPEGFKGQAFHVHIRYKGDWDELYFRDYLISHPDVCAEYAKLKVELYKKYEFDRNTYTEAKTDFIKCMTILARKEMPSKYTK
jgi:GrpB-like predicted nucleotidyltransferase (UPF0157 family)